MFTNYVIDQANKPYFYPIIGPTDQPMTRAYPMEDVEDERKDHPHHRSLWFGHQGVGGFDTWHEKMTLEERYAKKGPEELEKAMQGLGATVHREFKKVEANGNTTTIVVTNDYVDSAGEKLMADERTYTLRWENDARIFDVDIVLSAPYGPIELKDMKDAGFSIRVPTVLDLKSEAGGSVTNSEGIKDGDAWGKRAKWCDYSGIVAGEAVGVAILNHPSSFRFPTPWHVRNYGLFTANPFGLSKVAGEEDGTFVLEGGKTVDAEAPRDFSQRKPR